MIGFVTNGGFIDSSTADGLRKCLLAEFDAVYCLNLRGNQRTAGEISRKEGGKVFGAGSRSTVAVTLLVRKPGQSSAGRLYYRDVGDYLTREAKLDIVHGSHLETVPWMELVPSADGDWINQRSDSFLAYTPLGSKTGEPSLFPNYAGGLGTSRDAWVYNSSARELAANVNNMIVNYNDQVLRFGKLLENSVSGVKPKDLVEDFLDLDPKRISWSRSLKSDLANRRLASYEPSDVRLAAYRPFQRQRVYFNKMLNHDRSQLPKFFPEASSENFGFYVTGVAAAMDFSVLAVDAIPDFSMFGGQTNGLFFPRYSYERRPVDPNLFQPDGASADEGMWRRADNINAAVLEDYRRDFSPSVTADDLFHYTYGVLHSPQYRAAFAADLKKGLPRVPKPATGDEFISVATSGADLFRLHVAYQEAARYPLEEVATGVGAGTFRVTKMAFAKTGSVKDRTRIVYNSQLTLAGIPEEAYEYQLGSRSAIEWVMERYQVKTDKASGIVNDPNDWADEVGDPRYIVDLLKRIVTVSLETQKIVRGLPALNL